MLKPNFVRTYYVDEYGNYIYFEFGKASSKEDDDKFQFTLDSNEYVFVYELINSYRERYQYEIKFIASKKETTNAKFYVGDELVYTYVVGDGESRVGKDINKNGVGSTYAKALSSYEKLLEALDMQHYSIIDGVRNDFYINEVVINSDNLDETSYFYKDIDGDLKSIVINYLSTCKRAIVTLKYTDGLDKYNEVFTYGITFNGEREFEPIKYDNLYTNITYNLLISDLYDKDGLLIGKINRVTIVPEGKTEVSQSSIPVVNNLLSFSFNKIGRYTIYFGAVFTYDSLGYRVFNGVTYSSVKYSVEVYVSNSSGYGSITYVTTADHPFSDGSLEKTYTYLLKDKFKLIPQSEFEDTNGILIGWKTKDFYTFIDGGNDQLRLFYINNEIDNMITYFNSSNVTLYAEWDMGIKLPIEVDPLAMKNGVSYLNQDMIYFLNTTIGNPKTYYEIYWSDLYDVIIKYMRSDCELVGIQIGDATFTNFSNMKNLSVHLFESTIAKAIIKKSYKVEFVVDYSITSSAFKDEKILEGNTVSKSNKEELKIKKDGYSFLYWATIEDDVPTKFDLDTPITKNMVLYAIFEDPDGNLVWGVY